jgi:hypothetical protein
MRIREIEINNIKFYEFMLDYKQKIKEIEKILPLPKSAFLKIKKIEKLLPLNEYEKDTIITIIYDDFIKGIDELYKDLVFQIKNFFLQKGLKNLIIKEDIEEIENILFLLAEKYKEEDKIYIYYEELDKIKIRIQTLQKFLDKILSEFSKLVYKTDKQTILNQWLRESEK